jgi:hypothetical protein
LRFWAIEATAAPLAAAFVVPGPGCQKDEMTGNALAWQFFCLATAIVIVLLVLAPKD